MMRKEEEVFPKEPSKTYGLMELVKGTSPMVEKGPEETLFSWPHLLIMEVLVGLGIVLFSIAISVLVNAPLREWANPDITENPAKAPWYFMGLQELLLHMDPSLAGVIIPGLIVLILMAIPYIDRNAEDVGIWFASRKGKVIALGSALYAIVLLIALILFDEYIRVRSIINEPQIIPGWIIPLGVIGGLMALQYYIVMRPWRPNLREVLIGYFIAFVATYFVLIIIGTFFRGLGMHLTWPWELPPGALTF